MCAKFEVNIFYAFRDIPFPKSHGWAHFKIMWFLKKNSHQPCYLLMCLILGADFLHHHCLPVDITNKCLVDSQWLCIPSCTVETSTPQGAFNWSQPQILLGAPFGILVLTRPTFSTSTPTHGVHHIFTTGLPVWMHPCCLRLDKLCLAWEEFATMVQMAIICPSTSHWALPLHLVPKLNGEWRLCGWHMQDNHYHPFQHVWIHPDALWFPECDADVSVQNGLGAEGIALCVCVSWSHFNSQLFQIWPPEELGGPIHPIPQEWPHHAPREMPVRPHRIGVPQSSPRCHRQNCKDKSRNNQFQETNKKLALPKRISLNAQRVWF